MSEHVVVRESELGGTLDVSVGLPTTPSSDERLSALVRISTKTAVLTTELATAIADAMRQAVPPAPQALVVRVRTRKRATALKAATVRNAVVVVPVTERNARFLVAIVDAVRNAKPLGVQLVWDGSHARDRIFEVLERARSSQELAPVFVAKSEEPCFVLRAHAERRKETGRC